MNEYLLIYVAMIAVIAAVLSKLWQTYKAKQADALLFFTHTPHLLQPGTMFRGNVITRLVQVAPTELMNGDLLPCWQVYGKPNVESKGDAAEEKRKRKNSKRLKDANKVGAGTASD